jgi:hypothetical protein
MEPAVRMNLLALSFFSVLAYGLSVAGETTDKSVNKITQGKKNLMSPDVAGAIAFDW